MNNEFGSTSQPASIKDSVHKLSEQGGETMHTIKDRASEVADQLKTQYQDSVSKAMDFVQARPLASVGIAVVLGYYSRTIFRLTTITGLAIGVMQLIGRKQEL